MDWSLIGHDGGKTYVMVAEPGEDAVEALNALASTEGLSAAQITAVGAFARATVGWFDREQKQYRRIEIAEQCEVLSLLGDVAVGAGGPVVPVHVVLGLSNGEVRGGHLLAGQVWPTLEVVIREAPATLRKTDHPELGLALIDLERTAR